MSEEKTIQPVVDHKRLAKFKRRLSALMTSLFSNATAEVSSTSGTPGVVVTYVNGGLHFAFSGIKGETGASGQNGQNGTNGTNGANGTSSYLYIRYAASASPQDSGMHTSPQSGDKYIGFCSTTSSTAPTTAASYTWSKYVGENGSNGSNGSNGADGTTYTPTIGTVSTLAAGSSATAGVRINGTSVVFDFGIPRGADGTGIAIKPNAAACTQDGDGYVDQNTSSATYGHLLIYNSSTGTFSDGGEIKGPAGNNGISMYLYIRYASSATPQDSDVHTSPQSGDKYIGFCTTTSNAAPTTASSYTWSKYAGDDGSNGVGVSQVQWVSNSAGESAGTPGTTDTYAVISSQGATLGTFVVCNGANGANGSNGQNGTNGTNGTNGINGSNGADGTNAYLHIKYANNATGTNMHDTQTGSDKYIGILADSNSEASSDPTDYEWSKFVGENGQTGATGATGATGPQGPQGPQGTSGSIVSKAYRFVGDGTSQGSLLCGSLKYYFYLLYGDARITIDEKLSLANLHLTLYCKSGKNYHWIEHMYQINGYGMCSSNPGTFEGRLTGVKELALLPKDDFYGTVHIRHTRGWTGSAEDDAPILIDIHGVVSSKLAFDDLFTDNMFFELTMN